MRTAHMEVHVKNGQLQHQNVYQVRWEGGCEQQAYAKDSSLSSHRAESNERNSPTFRRDKDGLGPENRNRLWNCVHNVINKCKMTN